MRTMAALGSRRGQHILNFLLLEPMPQQITSEAQRVAELVRAEYPRLTDEEIIAMLWKSLGACNDELSRARYPDRSGQ